MKIRGKLIELKSNDDGTLTLTFDCKDQREFTISEPKQNTVVVDRGLIRDVCSELGELISLLGDDDERRRDMMLSLSHTLNKDR